MAEFYRISGFDAVPAEFRRCALAIGNFDGFHRGHQQVFATLRERAAARGAPTVLLTFEPHPRDVFAPQPVMFRLTPADAKARLARAAGLDGLIVATFDRAFSQIEPEEFVDRFLIGALDVFHVIVGEDFRFGRNRRGTPEFLREEGTAKGFVAETLEMVDEGHGPISSSRVREALRRGELDAANALLGYHWFLEGTVVEGDRRGRQLGYPTANLATPPVFDLFQGVYAVRAKAGGKLFDGVAAYGKPMFDNARPPFETHLFGFDGDLYGEDISVALVGLIRGQEVFDGLEALSQAMARDSATARDLLAAARPLGDIDKELGFFG